MKINKKLRAARVASGLSQTQLAALLGVEQPLISRWESGRRTPPVERLHRMLRLLDVVTPGDLGYRLVPRVVRLLS